MVGTAGFLWSAFTVAVCKPTCHRGASKKVVVLIHHNRMEIPTVEICFLPICLFLNGVE